MPLKPALCLAFGLIGLAACSSPQPAEAPAAIGTEAALQGTWRSVDDAKSMMTIRDTPSTASRTEPALARTAYRGIIAGLPLPARLLS